MGILHDTETDSQSGANVDSKTPFNKNTSYDLKVDRGTRFHNDETSRE